MVNGQKPLQSEMKLFLRISGNNLISKQNQEKLKRTKKGMSFPNLKFLTRAIFDQKQCFKP